jgi:predicted PurR-regulated permease PerM
MAEPLPPPAPDASAQRESELAPYLRVLVAGLVLYGLYVGRELLLPLVLAALMGFVLLPLVERMRHWGIRRGIAVSLVMMMTIGALFGAGLVLTTQTRALAKEWPQYQSTVSGKIREIREQMRLPTAFARTVDSLQVVDENSTAAMIATFLLYLVLILLDPADLRDRVIRLLGRNLHAATDALTEAGQRVSRYLLMQVIVGARARDRGKPAAAREAGRGHGQTIAGTGTQSDLKERDP